MGIMLGPSYIPNIPLSHGGVGVHQEHKLFGGVGVVHSHGSRFGVSATRWMP